MPDTPTATYLYVLSLDGPGRAWEYLRRNPGYCRAWATTDASDEEAARRWGLRFP